MSLALKREKYEPLENETVSEWGRRTVGELVSKRLIQRGLQGIYGPETGNLSASLCLAPIFAKSKRSSKGSLSFKNGMGSFIKVLENEVPLMGAQFENISDGGEKVQKPEGVSIICSPAHSLPQFVEHKFALIKYHSISTVTLIFPETARLPFKGFGCLFDEKESKGILGVILNSDLFDNRANEGEVSETWILNGDIFKSPEDLVNLLDFREEKFNKEASPIDIYFKWWKEAFPVYNLDLENEIKKINVKDDTYFFGNWTGKIGIGRLIEESPLFIKRVLEDLTSKKRKA